MQPIEKVNEYLVKAGTFYLTTVDGSCPKCRPLGFHLQENGKIYFGVGEFKEVYRQMKANPNVEICASTGGGFLRYYGEAVFEDSYDMADRIIAGNEFLQGIYNEQTGNRLGIFHLKNAVAEFRGMLDVQEKYSFD